MTVLMCSSARVLMGGLGLAAATNPLGEVAMATPAISEGTLLFRTRGHLVAVGGR